MEYREQVVNDGVVEDGTAPFPSSSRVTINFVSHLQSLAVIVLISVL